MRPNDPTRVHPNSMGPWVHTSTRTNLLRNRRYSPLNLRQFPLPLGASSWDVFTRADSRLMDSEPRVHPRFAAGQVIPKATIAAMFSAAVATPGLLELLETITDPVKTRQRAFLQSFRVTSSHYGKTFREVAGLLFEAGSIPLGLFRLDSVTKAQYAVPSAPLNDTELCPGDAIYVIEGASASAVGSGCTHGNGPGTVLPPIDTASTETPGALGEEAKES